MKRQLGRCTAMVLALVLVVGLAQQTGASTCAAVASAPLVISGTLEARQTQVASEVGERLVAVSVHKGDSVNAGDPLLTLDDSTTRAALAQADSAMQAARANLDQVKEPARPGALAMAQSGLKQATVELDAARRALEDANRAVANPQEILAQATVWQGKHNAALGEVAQAEAALASIKDQIEQAARDQSMAGKYTLVALLKQQQGAEATLRAAQANVAGSQGIWELYRRMAANPLELVANQHAAAHQVKIAQAGLLVAQAELDVVQREPQAEAVALAQTKMDAAQASLELVKNQLKRYSIVSPIRGIVLDRTVEPGETVRPGVPVLTLADTSELEMTLYAPIADFKSIRSSQAVRVRVPSLVGRTFSGRVTYVATAGEFKPANLYNSKERSEMVFAVRVTIPNGNGELKPGLPADAEFGGS